MKPLYFHNPKFRMGKNLTVRRGVKWDVGEKENIGIIDTNDPLTDDGKDKIIKVVNIETKVMRFLDISSSGDYYFEHDPKYETFSGLLNKMNSIYPGFNISEIVTLVYFDF